MGSEEEVSQPRENAFDSATLRSEFNQILSSAINRLNEGSQYVTPKSDPTVFRKRLSLKRSSNLAGKINKNEDDSELIGRLVPINSLIDSENNYLADLGNLQKNYLQPLKEKLILTPLQMATIFSNIEYIFSVNEELASRLNLVKLVAPRFQIIGEEFIRLGDYFGMYIQYNANLFKASKELQLCQKSNKRFIKFLETAHASSGTTLEKLLLKPVDRVRAYPNLLKKILDATPPEHGDYLLLKDALNLLESLVNNVENERRIIDNNLKILQIEQSIDGSEKYGQPGRWFLKQGDVLWHVDEQSKGNRNLFLFSDILLVTSRKGKTSSKSQFVVKEKLELKYLLLRDFPNPTQRGPRFDLVRNDQQIIYNLFFSSANSKQEWLQVFESTINAQLEIEHQKHVQERTEHMQTVEKEKTEKINNENLQIPEEQPAEQQQEPEPAAVASPKPELRTKSRRSQNSSKVSTISGQSARASFFPRLDLIAGNFGNSENSVLSHRAPNSPNKKDPMESASMISSEHPPKSGTGSRRYSINKTKRITKAIPSLFKQGEREKELSVATELTVPLTARPAPPPRPPRPAPRQPLRRNTIIENDVLSGFSDNPNRDEFAEEIIASTEFGCSTSYEFATPPDAIPASCFTLPILSI